MKAENNASSPFRSGAANIGSRAHRGYQVAVFGEPTFPLRNMAHRVDKPLPDRACEIRSGQSALAHIGEYRAAPFRDDEAVYDGERIVQVGHSNSPQKFRQSTGGSARPLYCIRSITRYSALASGRSRLPLMVTRLLRLCMASACLPALMMRYQRGRRDPRVRRRIRALRARPIDSSSPRSDGVSLRCVMAVSLREPLG